jgi:hypothetical protein
VSEQQTLDRATFEKYQAFMAGYVRRINQATFKVAIGGVRIGHAKYSRLAQINLKSRIITFSRYAIENVPERGRRYLVLHELAHVKESSHNKRFWDYVGQFEPDYRAIGQSLENAFKRNVTDSQRGRSKVGQLITHFALHEKKKEPVVIDTAGSTVLASSRNQDSSTPVNAATSVIIAPTARDDAELWQEIEQEYTYWRDDSDEDSDVDLTGTEYDDNYGLVEDCDD